MQQPVFKSSISSAAQSAAPLVTGSVLRRMFSLIRPYPGVIFFGLLGLAGGSGINLLLPEIVRRIINGNYFNYLLQHPFTIAVAFVALFALQGSFFYLRAYFFGLVGQRVVATLREKVFASIIDKPIEFFDTARVGDLVSRITADTAAVQDALTVKLSVFIRYSFQVVVGVALMLWYSPQLALGIVLCIPPLVFLSMVLGKQLRVISRQQQEKLGASAALAEEVFGGVRVVKAFNREVSERERFGFTNLAILKLGVKRTAASAFFSSFVSFLLNLVIVGIFVWGATLVAHGSLASGDLTAFLIYGGIVAVSFAFVAGGYSEFVQAIGAAERVFEFLDSREAEQHGAAHRIITSRRESSIELTGVSFFYPARPESQVLDNISFAIPAGTTTALVGPSGAGKSTIVALLLKFYEPSSGTIRFSDMEYRSAQAAQVRERIAFVPQDPQLFSLSIRENLLFGRPAATQDDLETACRQANILEFVRSLPQGFDTPIGERGVQLSGGQKQRLSIARAILKDPDLLILDEATSALDSESEHLVQEALTRIMKGKTCLVIAHRLSTVKNADQVIVIENGAIVQRGTHNSLTQVDGLYRLFVERQRMESHQGG